MFNMGPKSAAIKNAMAKRRYNAVLIFINFVINSLGKTKFFMASCNVIEV